MVEGAALAIPYPEAGVVERDTLEAQTEALAALLPAKPIVLGGCCCAHVGAARGLACRIDRLGVVWLDAHGDLNTPETSPSGNLWGMPLRMLLDAGVAAAEDVALVGARNLDPPEITYMAESGIDDSLERALAGVDAAYIALDLDVLDPTEVDIFMEEPDGPGVAEIEAVLLEAMSRAKIAGVGVTGLVTSSRNVSVITRLLAATGF
jgi:arginase